MVNDTTRKKHWKVSNFCRIKKIKKKNQKTKFKIQNFLILLQQEKLLKQDVSSDFRFYI